MQELFDLLNAYKLDKYKGGGKYWNKTNREHHVQRNIALIQRNSLYK